MSQAGAVSLVSFTHFGYHKDLKSKTTYHQSRVAAKSGLLGRLVVLDLADTYDIPRDVFDVPVPGGKTIPRGFYLLDRLSPWGFDARGKILTLFDSFAARRIGDERLVHTFPMLHRTLQAARDADSVAVVYGSTSHPDTNTRLFREEVERHGYSSAPTNIDDFVTGISMADYVLYLSEFSRRTYEDAGVDPERLVKVGPMGVNLDTYELTEPPDDEFVVVSVANMNVLKGTRYLLDAWERLDLPDARLVLCGSMTDAVGEQLKPRIEAMDDVEHVGYVSEPKPYYERASVLVHPSLTESFGKVISEAMASGVPVVVTEHCPTDYVDDAGLVAPIRDPDAIAEHLTYLYDNPDALREMGARGREIAEANTWEDFSARVADAHREILGREDP